MTDTPKWWMDHSNIVLLADWLAHAGEDGDAVAEAVRKPWNYDEEFYRAQAYHTGGAA